MPSRLRVDCHHGAHSIKCTPSNPSLLQGRFITPVLLTTVQNYLHGNPSSLDYCVALKRRKSTLILQPVRGLLDVQQEDSGQVARWGPPNLESFLLRVLFISLKPLVLERSLKFTHTLGSDWLQKAV